MNKEEVHSLNSKDLVSDLVSKSLGLGLRTKNIPFYVLLEFDMINS